MDAHTLQVLEFDKVVERVTAFAVSDPGRETVRELEPSPLPRVVANLQGETQEAKDLLVLTDRFPLDGIHDLRPSLERAAPDGAMLDGIELFRIAETLQAAHTLREFILGQGGKCPHLERLVRLIVDPRDLLGAITHAIDEEGRVVDDASPELSAIRQGIRRSEGQIRRMLDRLIRDPQMRARLQDDYVTIRDGRYVLPVRAHQKNEVGGIVHDRSDTGQTVFIEPTGVVSLGNELRDLIARERIEVRRVLRELTAQVRVCADAIAGSLGALAAADAICARARFSLQYHMERPLFGEDRGLDLVAAKHPLLLFAGVDAVPVDVGLDPDQRVLVISGPNAGGKTVALKTVGLLALMAQAGLHVPASERSVFWVFQDILADVGDEQSIEEALSSFSGHVARLRDILAKVAENALVLIDELGTATDPVEGGALACAVMEELYQSEAFAVVTTHLNAPKVMAHEYPAMANAAVQFDDETLAPTYQLTIGLPGSSHAFDVAKRVGLPEPIIDRAKARLGQGAAELEELLTTVRRKDRELDRELEAARASRLEAEGLEGQYREAMAEVDKRRRETIRQANLEAERVVADAQREAQAIIDDVKRATGSRTGPAVPTDLPGKVRRRAAATRHKHRQEAERLRTDLPDRLDVDEVAPDMDVFVISLSRPAKVVEVKRNQGRVTVAAGALRFEVKIEDLTRVPDDARESRPRSHARATTPTPHTMVERRLELIGKRVDEARTELGHYLEQAALCDHPEVCIVHGYGTGALRRLVREVLTEHPLVQSFRDGQQGEGGAGVTVARLAGEDP